jgi:phage terminase large subunit GpA-like protein
MLRAGEWRATAEGTEHATIGFHVSALYSPIGWLSWSDIARMWEAAQATDEAKRSFKNGVLGQTWVETGEALDWQRLYERREAWQIGTVPSGGLFLTAGADVQKDRIEVDIWAWGRGLESWLVDHIVIDGGPENSESWDALHRLLVRIPTNAARESN